MPFKSQSQRGKFYSMAKRGQMPMSTVNEWEADTPKGAKLPKSVSPREPKRKKNPFAPVAPVKYKV